jgi:WD40 repeat protein
VTADGARIATGPWADDPRLWDARTGALLAVLAGHDHNIYAVAFSPDGRTLLTGGRDQTVRVWDGVTGALRSVRRGHGQFITGLAFNADATRVLASSRFSSLMVWDAATYEPLVMLRGHDGAVRDAVFTPQEHRVVTASSDGTVRVWDARAPEDRAAAAQAAGDHARTAETILGKLRSDGGEPARIAEAVEADPDLEPAVRRATLNALLRACGAPDES